MFGSRYDVFSSYYIHCATEDVERVASEIVNKVIDKAQALVSANRKGLYIYKIPPDYVNAEWDLKWEENEQHADEFSAVKLPHSVSVMMCGARAGLVKRRWMRIFQFTLRRIIYEVKGYISEWELSPTTKALVMLEGTTALKHPLGKTYTLRAFFSNPTPACPTPLATAKVDFGVHVSKWLPKFYPIMVTYSFEGFSSQFYALDRRDVTSQRYFIDMIIAGKRSFFASISDLIFPCQSSEEPLDGAEQKSNKLNKDPVAEEDEEEEYVWSTDNEGLDVAYPDPWGVAFTPNNSNMYSSHGNTHERKCK